MSDTGSTGWTITAATASTAVNDLRNRKLHRHFAGYLAILKTSKNEAGRPFRVDFRSFYEEYFRLGEGSPSRPYIVPFGSGSPIANPNVAGSYAPSSLRQKAPLKEVVDVEGGKSATTYTLKREHALLARRHLLGDTKLPILVLVAFLYRDTLIGGPQASGYFPDLFISLFRNQFGFANTAQQQADFDTLFSPEVPADLVIQALEIRVPYHRLSAEALGILRSSGLEDPASIVRQEALSQIQQSDSYTNRQGEIDFQLSDGRLAFEEHPSDSEAEIYKREIQDIVGIIKAESFVVRLGNVNDMLAQLVEEYTSVFRDDITDREAIKLFLIGQQISKALVPFQATAAVDGSVDARIPIMLTRLVAFNEMYVQHFQAVVKGAEDLVRTVSSYRSVDAEARLTPWVTLEQFAHADELVEERTRDLILKLIGTAKEQIPSTSEAVVGFGFGTLKGALRTSTLPLLGLSKDVIKGLAIHELGRALDDPTVRAQWTEFFRSHILILTRLASDFPIHFHWLVHLQFFLG